MLQFWLNDKRISAIAKAYFFLYLFVCVVPLFYLRDANQHLSENFKSKVGSCSVVMTGCRNKLSQTGFFGWKTSDKIIPILFLILRKKLKLVFVRLMWEIEWARFSWAWVEHELRLSQAWVNPESTLSRAKSEPELLRLNSNRAFDQ